MLCYILYYMFFVLDFPNAEAIEYYQIINLAINRQKLLFTMRDNCLELPEITKSWSHLFAH